jgi:hypothetical protein
VWRFPLSMTRGDHQALLAGVIAKLAAEAGSAIRALLRGDAWELPIRDITFHLHLKNGKPQQRYIASHADGFLLAAQELIAAGARLLRQCQRRECRRAFIANRRQIFCSSRCAQDERTERYLAKHTPEQLSDRRHVRYVENVRRSQGPAVAGKVRRRPG